MKPIVRAQVVQFQAAEAKSESPYTLRSQYLKLNPNDQKSFETILKDLNTQWGYMGLPPVPDDEVLRYYFDEQPKGALAIAEVNKQDDPTLHNLRALGVPYWNRWAHSKFMRECDPMATSKP